MKLLKRFFFIIAFTTIVSDIVAISDDSEIRERKILQNIMNIDQLKEAIIKNQAWVSYPAYSDRTGWDNLTGTKKHNIIHNGEEFLGYEWRVVKATDYIEFERSGLRMIMQEPFSANFTALSHLLFAELAEGKGRFLDQIINGVWLSCEMTSWVFSAHLRGLSAHLNGYNSNKPKKEAYIDHAALDLGSMLAWTWYFLKEEMDRVDPAISHRLRGELQKRILDPYKRMSDYPWPLNNWTPWCHFNVLTCFLLLEEDPEMLAKTIHRTMVYVDKFIDSYEKDGACSEGTSYWTIAAGKLYDYLQLLHSATGGNLSIFTEPIIKNMGEYICRSYIGDGWMVNFGDGSSRGAGDKVVIFGYGKAVNSLEMKQFSAYLHQNDRNKSYSSDGRFTQKDLLDMSMNFLDLHVGYNSASMDIFRNLQYLIHLQEIENTIPKLPQALFTWYPQTELCYMRNTKGFFFGAFGGHNDQSHNHNDVGSFILFFENNPVFIDAGVGTYTRETFGNRYSLWTMQSDYHNLPLINGVSQGPGRQFKSKNVSFNEKLFCFKLDIAEAFKPEADVKSWIRSYTLQPEGGLIIEDEFQLKTIKETNRVNFLTRSRPDISNKGIVLLETNGEKIQLKYDSNQFDPVNEAVELTDYRLTKVWGNMVYRLTLLARKKQIRGSYKFTVNKYSL